MAVKAYDYAHLSERRVKDLEAVGRRSVIILLVKLLGLRDMNHFRTVEHLTLRIYPQRGIVSFAVKLKVHVRRHVIAVIARGGFEPGYHIAVRRQNIFRHVALFILRKKRRELDLGEKQQVASARKSAHFKRGSEVFIHAVGHAHLRHCKLHFFYLRSF